MVRTNQKARMNREYLEIKIREPLNELNAMYLENEIKSWSPARVNKYKKDSMEKLDNEINRRMEIDNKKENIIRDAKEWAEIGINPKLEIKKEEINILKEMCRSGQNKMFFKKLNIVNVEIKNRVINREAEINQSKSIDTKEKQREQEPALAR